MMMMKLLFLLFLLPGGPAEACGGPQHTSPASLLLCRACGAELARGSDVVLVSSRLALSSRNHTLPGGRRVHVQLFENPHGLRFEVMTFRRAEVTQHWPADPNFSWFPGFSWTIATCPRCHTHLGWGFQPTAWPDTITKTKFEESDQTFLALITHRLLSEDFASSLLVTPKSFTS